MITRLRAKNFKSWKDTGELRLAPLTGLFGTNSSGKTSIMQILLMLKQTVESPDRKRVLHTGDERSLIDLGTFFDLIHGHRPDTSLELSISWNLPQPLMVKDPERKRKHIFDIRSLSFTTSVREESNRLVVDSFVYEFDDHAFEMSRAKKTKGEDRYHLDHYHSQKSLYGAYPVSAPVKCYGFPPETAYNQNTFFLPDFVLALEEMFSRIAYLGPLREYPKRSYIWAGERPIDVGRRGDQAVAALLAARAEGLKSGRGKGKARRYKSIEERVLEWMQKMEVIHSFSLKSIAENRKDYEFRVKKSKTSSEVLITDVGFGVSQLLPVLVLCYYVSEGSIILLEQPEIHLHPFVQSCLADVLIDVVKERNVQIIFESHSEHLLRRLQRRIAERAIGPDKTALYFSRTENAVSKIERLDVDDHGSITNWPQGFFGDELGDLVAMTEAAIQHKQADPS